MANSLLRLLFWITWAGLAASQIDTDVCDVVTTSCGLIPPPLPSNFELAGEIVDHLQNTSAYIEVFFDSVNLRGKYMYLQNGIEHHLLFDYETTQIIEYDLLHPGVDIKRDPLSHICTTAPLVDSKYRFIFGYKDRYFETKHSRMYDVNEALRFGGRYKYAYNGTEDIQGRGIPADKFRGCVYDRDMEATIDYTYHFTNAQVGPAGGTMESEVDDTDNSVLLSVPVKMEMRGNMMKRDENFNKKSEPVQMTENLSWFKGYPKFETKKFQIPPLMNCKDYRGRKPMPKFPLAFSSRIEMTSLTQDLFGEMTVGEVISFYEVWYDNDKELVRRDYKPVSGVDTEIFAKFQSYGPVREVYDFKTGILYITNKASGRCFTRVITSGDFFETSKNTMFIKLGTPEEVFQMETDNMEYKGKSMSRDINCDVWNGQYEDKILNKTLVKETYYSTDGWHEEADDKVSYSVPVKHSVISTGVEDAEYTETIRELNFLKFRPVGAPYVVYDVSNCIETINHKFFAIILSVPKGFEDTVRDYRFRLLEYAQSYLVAISEVTSFLRIQKLELREIEGKFVLIFALVGKVNLKNPLFPVKGISLEGAQEALKRYIDSGLFIIKFPNPGNSNQVIPIIGLPGGLIDLSPKKEQKKNSFGEQRFEETRNLNVNLRSEIQPEILFEEEKDNVVEKEGMSKGSLALLSIAMLAIGIGIGIALMYLYIRKYRDQNMENDLVMQNTGKS